MIVTGLEGKSWAAALPRLTLAAMTAAKIILMLAPSLASLPVRALVMSACAGARFFALGALPDVARATLVTGPADVTRSLSGTAVAIVDRVVPG